MINVDQERISQVPRNIIGNALKFSDKNSEIRLEVIQRVEIIEVAVHDTGPGIVEEGLEKIFKKFKQVISIRGETIKGAGVGLATVKQVILVHGGKVCATSQVGKGSTSHFTLQLAV